MFGALKEIGEAMLSGGGFEVERIKGKGTLLAKIIFDLDGGNLDCDCSIKCDLERAKEYLWVGNAVGQRSQLVLTTDKSQYLLDSGKASKWAIGQIIYEIDGKGLKDNDIKGFQLVLSEIKKKLFPDVKNRVQEFEALLVKKGCRPRDIALYTACVRKDGKIVDLVKTSGYRKFLHYVLYATESEDYPIMTGRCHICGEEKEVLTNPSYPEGSPLCIYNVDKAGFLPNLHRKPENLLRAHVVCPDCKMKLRLGLKFVEQNLTATIGETAAAKLNVFLIPKVMGAQLSYEQLGTIASKIKGSFNAVKAYKNLEEVERLMRDFAEFEDPYSPPRIYFLNLLFGYRVSSHFSFQYLIQNVPVTRIMELARLMTRASNDAMRVFKEKHEQWSIGFEEIYSIFPLKKMQKTVDWKPLVELFNSMLNGTRYPEESIISKAILFTKIYRYGTYGGYNLKPPRGATEAIICRGIFKYNLILKLLMEIGSVEMETVTDSCKIPDEEIEKFFSAMKYAEWQKALFLLGLLVGKIGIEQHKRGDEKKAVLNKINFEGMPAERVKLLSVHVLEGLRNYRALDSRSEAIYAYMKTMMDRNLEAFQNPIDNVFYILSGYAYATLQAITSRR